MNKRIKKKKAKQAELKRQQELEQLAQNPEQIRQIFMSVGTAISNVFTTLSVAFANAADQWKKWGEQFDKENSK
ncbi:TPA: hypothetical protein ACI0DN_000932 [Streptococcus agalactiae]|uniref:hypothetical protein n=1 Tax=Streptococcus agalactiae TaxID=1311 RepID=UPI0002BB50DE|nr:hypothetical protein [Streptococcus agalactiae]HEP3595823.1 hypothetical protein [Streptococcus pyogenes]EPT97933.1 hypothetical protein SAG0108_06025 [Streptococcus agalactiae BSU92]CND60883.1 Uncharacterised protein [Streptococcus agalactiae]CNI02778.1 Uncharacterised protein [Streptococcus agalactiae]HEN5990764.1 hypothetical protein [Streptococcus agalactiae]